MLQVARHDYYSEVLSGSRVIAVFAGHLHPQGGFKRAFGGRKDDTTSSLLYLFDLHEARGK